MEKPFEEEMFDVMNKSSVALMLSIGHRTHLFDVISGLPPSTSETIAKKSNLNERYVREWLGSMVTSKIMDYDSKNGLFSLSEEKADYLTKQGSYNFASSMQWFATLAQVEDKIIECFKNGGGVPYESYHRFHEVMAEESNQTTLAELINGILPLAPGLMEKLEKGIKVLDVGCGSGRAINLMAKTFPNSVFTGYDFSQEAIQNAQKEATSLGLSNAFFERMDVANFSNDGYFDLITAFDAIHDQANPEQVLKNIKTSLGRGGLFLMQDIGASSKLENNMDNQLSPFLYAISCLHCMTVSLAQGGRGLGAVWGQEKASEMLRDAGFSNITVKQLEHDPINYYYIVK